MRKCAILVAALVACSVILACQAFLALTIIHYSSTDCHRTTTIVQGIYGIVDRSLAGWQEAYRVSHSDLARQQLRVARVKARHVRRDITLPSC